ncbi:MAG: hypothetical protein ACLT01_02175, partial [Clostridia bacterium]
LSGVFFIFTIFSKLMASSLPVGCGELLSFVADRGCRDGSRWVAHDYQNPLPCHVVLAILHKNRFDLQCRLPRLQFEMISFGKILMKNRDLCKKKY